MFSGFMANADLSFGVLGTELWSPAGLGLARQALRRFGRRGMLAFAATVLVTGRDWLGETFESEAARGLLAPWVLHTGLGPDQAASGFMTQVIACALQLGGLPVPKGGGVRLVDALAAIVRDAGGELRSNAEVERVLVSGGRATSVRLAGGETIRAERAVVASVTPTQRYGSLLDAGDVPEELGRAAARYRYGRGEMQIHLALGEPPEWYGDERLPRTAIVHVTPGRDGVSRAVNEAERGLLPSEATIVCGQPMAVDASRGPDGSWILWVQLQELPAGRVKSDAAGELDVGDGSWSETLREAYADRIVARLGRHIQNLERATIARVVLSPADIEAANVNLVGGDIYGGSCALDQNFLFRPLPQAPGHRTPVEGLWHIGASTHPGPGLGAGSGYLVYKELTRPALPRRLLARVPVVGR
jgi:phytoene dehydrogenase-like protein